MKEYNDARLGYMIDMYNGSLLVSVAGRLKD